MFPISIKDFWLFFYLSLLSLFLLVFGIGFRINWQTVKPCISWLDKNFILGSLFGFILLSTSTLRFRRLLKKFYIYKKDILKRLPFALIFFIIIMAAEFGILLIVKYDYKIVFKPAQWDKGTILLCLLMSLIFASLAPPVNRLSQRFEWLQDVLPNLECNKFAEAHRNLRIEIKYQEKIFNNVYGRASEIDRVRLRERLRECYDALERIIAREKNRKLRTSYQRTNRDILQTIKLIDWFKNNINYARFITKDKFYIDNSGISKNVSILERLLSLDC